MMVYGISPHLVTYTGLIANQKSLGLYKCKNVLCFFLRHTDIHLECK